MLKTLENFMKHRIFVMTHGKVRALPSLRNFVLYQCWAMGLIKIAFNPSHALIYSVR